MLSEQEKQVWKDYLVKLEELRDFEHDHRINYFGIRDEDRIKRHSECCKLGKGLNPKQQEVLDSWPDLTKRIFVWTGGNKQGRTTFCACLIISILKGYLLWDKEKKPISNPPVIIRWIGQDWETHIKTVLEAMLDMWWPKDWIAKTSKNNQGVKATYRCDNKSILYILSNKQESDVHEGKDPHYVFCDEPPKRPIYIANKRGLSATRKSPATFESRTFITATLLKEPWIDREIIKRRNDDGTLDLSVCHIHGTIWDNLGFGMTEEGIDEFAKDLTPEEKQARLHGIPSYMSGLIYPQFKREIHLKKRFKIPIHWPVDIAIDCHPKKEHAVLFEATDPRNYKYLCDEIFMHGDGTALGEEIIRFIKRNSYRVNVVLIDHSAKGDQNNPATTFDKIDTVLARYGCGLVTYKKDETGGIRNTELLLESENKETVLWVFDDLGRTIWEFEGYMYDPETGKPIDKDNDMMDNLYALSNEDTQYRSPTAGKRMAPPVNWRIA